MERQVGCINLPSCCLASSVKHVPLKLLPMDEFLSWLLLAWLLWSAWQQGKNPKP